MGLGLRPASLVCYVHRRRRSRPVHRRRAAHTATTRCCRCGCSATTIFALLEHRRRRHRRGHVRRHLAAPAVPADRARAPAPTEAGLAHAAADGRHHGRVHRLRPDHLATGRYKIFPIIGTALMVGGAGAPALHASASTPRCGRSTSTCRCSASGSACRMQTLVLAVQNAVPPRDMGVATASTTFFRQMGGTLGAAVFLSVLFSTVTGNIADAFRKAAGTPEFQQALADPAVRANPANGPVIASLSGGGDGGASNVLADSSFLQTIDPRLARPFLAGFADSMAFTFIIVAIVLAIAFFIVLFVKELPLRTMSGAQARAMEDAALAEAGPAAAPLTADGRGGAEREPHHHTERERRAARPAHAGDHPARRHRRHERQRPRAAQRTPRRGPAAAPRARTLRLPRCLPGRSARRASDLHLRQRPRRVRHGRPRRRDGSAAGRRHRRRPRRPPGGAHHDGPGRVLPRGPAHRRHLPRGRRWRHLPAARGHGRRRRHADPPRRGAQRRERRGRHREHPRPGHGQPHGGRSGGHADRRARRRGRGAGHRRRWPLPADRGPGRQLHADGCEPRPPAGRRELASRRGRDGGVRPRTTATFTSTRHRHRGEQRTRRARGDRHARGRLRHGRRLDGDRS